MTRDEALRRAVDYGAHAHGLAASTRGTMKALRVGPGQIEESVWLAISAYSAAMHAHVAYADAVVLWGPGESGDAPSEAMARHEALCQEVCSAVERGDVETAKAKQRELRASRAALVGRMS